MLVDLDWYAIEHELDKCVMGKCLPNLTLIAYVLSWTRLYTCLYMCVELCGAKFAFDLDYELI